MHFLILMFLYGIIIYMFFGMPGDARFGTLSGVDISNNAVAIFLLVFTSLYALVAFFNTISEDAENEHKEDVHITKAEFDEHLNNVGRKSNLNESAINAIKK